jgi:hypothetical protein
MMAILWNHLPRIVISDWEMGGMVDEWEGRGRGRRRRQQTSSETIPDTKPYLPADVKAELKEALLKGMSEQVDDPEARIRVQLT